MSDELRKDSKITIRSDWPVGGSSRQHGANLDAIGFNLRFIMERNPRLAVDVIELYQHAIALRVDDPVVLRQQDHRSAMAELGRLDDWPAA